MKHPYRLALAVAVAATVAGCSGFGFKSNEYKGATARTSQPLEVPPELTAPSMDDRYAIPDPKTQTTYSAYSQRSTPGGAPSANSNAVLPPIAGARMERAGDQRWLVVKGEPERVWQVVRDFWVESGYTLAREEPQTGIIETDWYDDKTKVPQDVVRRTVGRIAPNLFGTPRRDRFRTRLEKGADPGTTEIFLSSRQVEEIFTTNNQDATVWQSRPPDRELEAEMLARMLVRLGAVQQLTAAAPTTPAGRAGTAAVPDARNAVLQNDGAGPLVVNDSFDRAWRRVGLALDRVGFTVEDRDRSKGVFFVRYIDPEVDMQSGQKKKDEGILDKLKFWKSAPKPGAQPQYRIHVSDAGASMSQVLVQDSKGTTEQSSTSKKILGLLFEQLK